MILNEKDKLLPQNQQLPGNRRLWTRTEKKVWMTTLFIGSACIYMARTIMPVCAVVISQDLGWDKSQTGFVLSTFFWGYITTQVLGGYLSDKFGGERVISTVSLGWILLTLATPHAPDFIQGPPLLYLMVLIRVLIGASQGIFYPSLSSVVSTRVTDTEKSTTYAVIGAGAHCGTLLSGSFGSVLLERVGWKGTFYAVAIFSLTWLLVTRYWLLEELEKGGTDADRSHDHHVVNSSETHGHNVTSSVPVFKLFRSFAFWALLMGHFCKNWSFFILLSWMPTYFEDTFPEAKAWVFNVVPWLVNIPVSVVSGIIADRLIHRGWSTTTVRKLMESPPLLGIGLLLFSLTFTTTYGASLTLLATAIGFTGFHNAGILMNPSDIAPNHAGAVFGMMNMAGALPGFLGVYITGHILETTHSWSAVFTSAATVSCTGWVLYTTFGTAKRIV